MKRIIFILLILFFCTGRLTAEEEELFFTYIGPCVGFGTNQIAYRGWSSETNTRITKVIPGYFFSGGCLFDIFVKSFIGEFGLEYINNFNSGKPDVSVQNLIYTGTAKYSYALQDNILLTCGPGVYLETPPATVSSYKGGGLNCTIGAVYTLTREWRIIFDVLSRYGYFGMGDYSSKFSIGVKIGMVYKVGRI